MPISNLEGLFGGGWECSLNRSRLHAMQSLFQRESTSANRNSQALWIKQPSVALKRKAELVVARPRAVQILQGDSRHGCPPERQQGSLCRENRRWRDPNSRLQLTPTSKPSCSSASVGRQAEGSPKPFQVNAMPSSYENLALRLRNTSLRHASDLLIFLPSSFSRSMNPSAWLK
jgi:hypothetical protein